MCYIGEDGKLNYHMELLEGAYGRALLFRRLKKSRARGLLGTEALKMDTSRRAADQEAFSHR